MSFQDLAVVRARSTLSLESEHVPDLIGATADALRYRRSRRSLLGGGPRCNAAGETDRLVVSMIAQERDRLPAPVSRPAICDALHALWDLQVTVRKSAQRHQDRAVYMALGEFFRLAHIQKEEERLRLDQRLQIADFNGWNGYLRSRRQRFICLCRLNRNSR